MVNNPINQNQHKIPEVYLKQWGYINSNNQPMVSVMKIGEKWTRQKSIGSFLSATNIFDIPDADDYRIPRVFEALNSEFDNKYNDIINDLVKNRELTEENYAILLQFIPNLMCRSDYWRDWCYELIEEGGNGKVNFIKVISAKYAKDSGDYETFWKTSPLFLKLIESKTDDIINRVLLLFTSHILDTVGHFEISFFKSEEDKFWTTSDNPVIFKNKPEGKILFGRDSEFYFPITPEYLAYFHYPKANCKKNPLRGLKINTIHEADAALHEKLKEETVANAIEYILFPGEFKYRIKKEL
jgi:uncharacterized protein DUF4238